MVASEILTNSDNVVEFMAIAMLWSVHEYELALVYAVDASVVKPIIEESTTMADYGDGLTPLQLDCFRLAHNHIPPYGQRISTILHQYILLLNVINGV